MRYIDAVIDQDAALSHLGHAQRAVVCLEEDVGDSRSSPPGESSRRCASWGTGRTRWLRVSLAGYPRNPVDRLLLKLDAEGKIAFRPPLFPSCFSASEREALLTHPTLGQVLFVELNPANESLSKTERQSTRWAAGLAMWWAAGLMMRWAAGLTTRWAGGRAGDTLTAHEHRIVSLGAQGIVSLAAP